MRDEQVFIVMRTFIVSNLVILFRGILSHCITAKKGDCTKLEDNRGMQVFTPEPLCICMLVEKL